MKMEKIKQLKQDVEFAEKQWRSCVDKLNQAMYDCDLARQAHIQKQLALNTYLEVMLSAKEAPCSESSKP
jgi:hypothetical protein